MRVGCVSKKRYDQVGGSGCWRLVAANCWKSFVWAEGFLAAWEFHRSEVVEIVDAGDRLVAMLHLVGRGIGSGVEMDETDAHVFTIRAGRIVRWQNFDERADALAALGLQE